MKNKKGISIGRILLYVLFLSLIGLFVWTLFITFKAMKKKSPGVTESVNSSLRFAYNNQFDYSAADYLGDCYLNFYNNSDLVFNYLNGGYNNTLASRGFSLDSVKVYTTMPSPDYYDYVATVQDKNFSSNVVPYYISSNSAINDNVFHFASILNNFYSFAVDGFPRGNNNQYTWSYFFPSSDYGSYKSAALIINCDIPLEVWSGTCTGIFNNSESWLLGDDNVLYRYQGGFSSFSYNSLPSSMRANCSKITKIILPVWQNSNDNGLGYYFLGGNYNYYYQSFIDNYALGDASIDFTFTIFSQDNNYQVGYEAGYSAGVQNADAALRETNIDLVNQINNLDSSINDMRSQIAQQQIIIDNLNTQLQAQTNNFKGLFFTMADIPFKTVSNALGFEFWGVNLFRFFVGIITALGILWLIKRLYK